MTKKDDSYTDVLLEDINSKFDFLVESVGGMQDNVKKIPKMAEQLEKLEYDMSMVKMVTRVTNDDMKLVKIRTERLEGDVKDIKSATSRIENKLDATADKVDDHETRIVQLEQKPA